MGIIIALGCFALVIVIIAFVSIRQKKYDSFLSANSIALKSLREINQKYISYPRRIRDI